MGERTLRQARIYGDQLIGSNDPQRKTYILVKGKLVVMPDGLCSWCRPRSCPLCSRRFFRCAPRSAWPPNGFIARMWSLRRRNRCRTGRRHYGPEMVDRLADPLLSGVYGGEASQLSVRAVLARFADMEAKHGSLGRGMVAARKKMSAGVGRPPAPLFTSLKEGMQQTRRRPRLPPRP